MFKGTKFGDDADVLRLLEDMPLSQVSNEGNFFAPLLIRGRTAECLTTDVERDKKRIADALGKPDHIWFEHKDNADEQGRTLLKGTVLDSMAPIKGTH